MAELNVRNKLLENYVSGILLEQLLSSSYDYNVNSMTIGAEKQKARRKKANKSPCKPV